MPIYAQTYRTFEGRARRRFRWWIMVTHELRILSRSKAFIVLFIIGYLHVCFRLLQVVTYDTLNLTPNNPLVQALRNVEAFTVDSSTFCEFIQMQSGLVFLSIILAGAGMICNDYRYNLMEIYFSKPLSWRDYAIGKIVTLLIVGFTFTAFPAVGLVVAHNFLAPSVAALKASVGLVAAIFAFSLTLVLPCALGVLASSALSRSQRYASIAIFMVLFADLTIGRLLPTLLHQPSYAVIAFPLAVNRIGELVFQVRRPLLELSWQWSIAFIVTACAVCLWIICRNVRRAEVAV